MTFFKRLFHLSLITLLAVMGCSQMALAQFGALTQDEYAYCTERWNRTGVYYDCDCIKENTPVMRQQMSDSLMEKDQKRVAGLEKKIAKTEAQLEKPQKKVASKA